MDDTSLDFLILIMKNCTRLVGWVIGIAMVFTYTVNVAAEKMIIKVALVPFFPYMEVDQTGKFRGVVVDLIAEMNTFQQTYEFVGIETSPMRRFEHFQEGKYDLSMTDRPEWGWTDRPNLQIDVSNVYLRGSELYVALSKDGRGEEYFENFQGKRLVGILGYHYGFANFNADPDFLRKNFNIQLITNHEGLLKKIESDRADIAIVNSAYFSRLLLQNPEMKGKFLVAQKVDQTYEFAMILRKGMKLQIEELNQLLADMKQAGVLQKLWQQYGIEEQ